MEGWACSARIVLSGRRFESFGAPQPELKGYLTEVYGLDVEKINTLNYEGKKKRGKHGYYRNADWKKAYVTLKRGLQPSAQQVSEPRVNALVDHNSLWAMKQF